MIDLRLRSATPGRERWEADVLRSRRRLSELVAERLRAAAPFRQVEVNPVTARVLVLFDPAALDGQAGRHIEAALSAILQGGLPAEERPR
ncbi:MAG: hypothetical protein M3O15_04555, partial [Acidobacteriota bacterium]|nr:hypothetical protein [Acidobacteriota bacterium]